jgi:hypothetical protein
MAQWIKEVVDTLPPLTGEQRDLLALIFRRHRSLTPGANAPPTRSRPAGRSLSGCVSCLGRLRGGPECDPLADVRPTAAPGWLAGWLDRDRDQSLDRGAQLTQSQAFPRGAGSSVPISGASGATSVTSASTSVSKASISSAPDGALSSRMSRTSASANPHPQSRLHPASQAITEGDIASRRVKNNHRCVLARRAGQETVR